MDSNGGVGTRILLVDDQPDQIEMYQFALEHAGFAVDTAPDGGTAIAVARTRLPNVIVLDIRLPDMDGWQVCRVLKSDPATAPIPIVILTAAVSGTMSRQATESGCAAHLVKPCFPDDLTRTIRDVLTTA